MKQYRIIPKKCGRYYKIQCKRKWFPIWLMVGFFQMLSFSYKSDAIKWIDETENPLYYTPQKDKTI